jgi:hypothetical protein
MPNKTYDSGLVAGSVPMTGGFYVDASAMEAEAVNADANPDFIPSEYKLRKLKVSPRHPARDPSIDKIPAQVINEGVEWRAQADQEVIDKGRKGKIDLFVERIRAMHKDGLAKFKRAKKHLASLTPEDLEFPSKKTRNAMAIVRKGPPITKEDAYQQARAHVIKHGG